MDTLLKTVQTINMYLSDYVLIILLLGAGLYFTIRTRFVQVRCFGEGWRRFFGEFSLNGEKHKSGMSSFQALATAVASAWNELMPDLCFSPLRLNSPKKRRQPSPKQRTCTNRVRMVKYRPAPSSRMIST